MKRISTEAWQIIGATFEENAPKGEGDDAPSNGAFAPFNEGLLRDILNLEPEQQLELVLALAEPDKNKRISKGSFKTRAESYQARNRQRLPNFTRDFAGFEILGVRQRFFPQGGHRFPWKGTVTRSCE